MTTKGYTVLWDKISATIKTEFDGRGLDYDDFDDLPRRVPMYVFIRQASDVPLNGRFSEIEPTRPESVVERMALPQIRGGTGPVKVEQHGYEG